MKWKQPCFNSTYHSLQAFGGHCLHYQAQINTNLKLFARIGLSCWRFLRSSCVWCCLLSGECQLWLGLNSLACRVKTALVGKAFGSMEVRVSEHRGVSPRTGKHLKVTLSTSVRDHMLDCIHIVTWGGFKGLRNGSLVIDLWRWAFAW